MNKETKRSFDDGLEDGWMWGDIEKNQGMSTFDLEAGECILFDTKFPHRGPGGGDSGRFSLFTSYTTCPEGFVASENPENYAWVVKEAHGLDKGIRQAVAR